jgi:hypothetical protein
MVLAFDSTVLVSGFEAQGTGDGIEVAGFVF